MTHYLDVVVETYSTAGGTSEKSIRVRPLPGQQLSPSMNVECSLQMRHRYPVGTKFILRCKVTDRQGSPPFLYTHYNWPYRVLTDAEAAEFIRANRNCR